MKTYKNIWENVGISSQKLESYFEFYQTELLPYIGKPITLLEIGVAEGGNLIALRTFLGNEARIIGLDFRTPQNLKILEEHNIEFIKGVWQDKAIFRKLISELDVLIDDGPHDNKSTINSIIYGLKHLKPGGKIFIEDLHTNFMLEFGNPSRYSTSSLLYKLVEKMHKKTLGQSGEEISRIRTIKFGPSICVIELNSESQFENLLIKSESEMTEKSKRMYGGLTKSKLLNYVANYWIKYDQVYFLKLLRIGISFLIYRVKDLSNIKYFFKI
jgi:hypothetical protein